MIVAQRGPSRSIRRTELHGFLFVVLFNLIFQGGYISRALSVIPGEYPQISQHGWNAFAYYTFYYNRDTNTSCSVEFIGQQGLAELH